MRGDPDDLLLISGRGLSAADTVVYETTVDSVAPFTPSSVPTQTSAAQGVTDLVSSADAPYALTVHLPALMTANQPYALWIVTPDGQWSAPVLINDARPLWITPDNGYRSAGLANLPRVLKVVGRNLEPFTAATSTQVRLVGVNTGTSYTLTANNTSNDPSHTTTALERYVAAVNLPATMVVDHYTVRVSRDGTNWVPLLGDGRSAAQTFNVAADPVAQTQQTTFNVSSYAGQDGAGPCLPDDGIDDTACILLAMRAAEANGGGTVTFGPGTWLVSKIGPWSHEFSDVLGLYESGSCAGYFDTCAVTYFGLYVPQNVNLQGSGTTGANPTIVERGAYTGQATDWPLTWPIFTLQGHNVVSGIKFTDDNNYLSNYASGNTNGGFVLQLGGTWYWATGYEPPAHPLKVSDVVITNNVFDKPYMAITDGGLPLDHVYITYNTFGGAFNTAIVTGGDENSVVDLLPNQPMPYQTFGWEDAVVSHNTFYPSSFQVTQAAYDSNAPGGNGSAATDLRSGHRADFSDNLADGTSTQYFYNPTDPKGWRAAFFWSTGEGMEMTLVSNNQALCSGDKYGDGEAIVYEGGASLGGMPVAQPVVSAAPWTDANGVSGTTVVVQGVVTTQFQTSSGLLDISAFLTPYYQGGFWLQVVQGVGKGQWRRVESLSLGTNGTGSTIIVNVAPAFDVPPDATTKVVFDRGYRQNATINNYVDQRTPLCTKQNARESGGTLSWFASTADSAMEGNRQYDTSGILLHETYQPQQSGTGAVLPVGLALQDYNEVRNNIVNGAYDWSGTGKLSGIQFSLGATSYFCPGNTCPAPAPPIVGVGFTIAGNVVTDASARDSAASIGAIGSNSGWETGVLDAMGLSMWEIDSDALIFNNTMQGISSGTAGAGQGPLVAIAVDVSPGTTVTPAITWRSTLYNNSCVGADTPVSDFGLGTVRYCPSGHTSSCECSGTSSADVGITATGSAGPVSAGSSVTYNVTIGNHSTATTATDVNLSLEPSAGVVIASTSFTSSQGSCDSSINVCLLGGLAPGQSATVTVNGTLPTSGTWPITFSVTHHESDAVPSNDSVSVIESVQ